MISERGIVRRLAAVTGRAIVLIALVVSGGAVFGLIASLNAAAMWSPGSLEVIADDAVFFVADRARAGGELGLMAAVGVVPLMWRSGVRGWLALAGVAAAASMLLGWTLVGLPAACCVAASVIGVRAWFGRLIPRECVPGLCDACGYCVTGLPTGVCRCPECGCALASTKRAEDIRSE